jgi:hypothetical protein
MTLNCGKSDLFLRSLSNDNLTVLSLLTVHWWQQVSWQVHGAAHTNFPYTIQLCFKYLANQHKGRATATKRT